MFIKTQALSDKMKSVRLALTLCIILTLGFIFTQSMLPSEIAGKESDAVSGILSSLLPPGSALSDLVENNMDKIAHFTEFSALGFFVSLYICFFAIAPIKTGALSLLFAETVAIFDETIQIFSGRNPDINDVWCDLLGFFTLSVITYLAFFTLKWLLKKE